MTQSDAKAAEAMIDGVSPKLRDDAMELALDVLFMRKKLNSTRRSLAKANVAEEYTDSYGGKRTKENPAFAAYEKLLKSYISALDKLEAMTGAKPEERKAIKVDVLTEFQSKYKRRNA